MRRSRLLLVLPLALTALAACSDASLPTASSSSLRPTQASLTAATAPGWDWTGPGTGDVTLAGNTWTFAYGYDTGCCESGAWNYTATAATTSTLQFDWQYDGFHGWFYDRARAVVWAQGPGGLTQVTLVSTTPNGDCEFSGTNCGNDIDGPFAFAGANSIQLHAGYAWGVTIDGDNGDCCGALNGTLAITRRPYDFTGFYSPIENLPAVNAAKAGSSIPVKFSLGGDQGLSIFAAGSPSSAPIACGGDTPGADVGTETAGASTLSYDPTTDTYTYVWKTEKAWAGTCRVLTVALNDGSSRSAQFYLK